MTTRQNRYQRPLKTWPLACLSEHNRSLRQISLAHLWNSCVLTAHSSSAILVIVAVALFGWVLAVGHIPLLTTFPILTLAKDFTLCCRG